MGYLKGPRRDVPQKTSRCLGQGILKHVSAEDALKQDKDGNSMAKEIATDKAEHDGAVRADFQRQLYEKWVGSNDVITQLNELRKDTHQDIGILF